MFFLRLPSVAENIESMTLHSWLADEGDELSPGDELARIITEKAEFTYEIEEDLSGRLLGQLAEGGSVLPVGYIIAVVGEESEREDALFQAKVENDKLLSSLSKPSYDFNLDDAGDEKKNNFVSDKKVRATPAARRIAKEKDLSLSDVAAFMDSDGIVREEDIIRYLESNK